MLAPALLAAILRRIYLGEALSCLACAKPIHPVSGRSKAKISA